MPHRTSILLLLIAFGLSACSELRTTKSASDCVEEKIAFELDFTNQQIIDFEFCIPKSKMAEQRVSEINTSIQFNESSGRIGCNTDQYLCLGSVNSSPTSRDLLCRLSLLPFINRIDQNFWE